jgi:hypothetical protein
MDHADTLYRDMTAVVALASAAAFLVVERLLRQGEAAKAADPQPYDNNKSSRNLSSNDTTALRVPRSVSSSAELDCRHD